MCGRSKWFCFGGSTSLTVHGELNRLIVSSHHMFTPTDWLTWLNVGGGCYKMVPEHSSTLGLDGLNVFVMHACRLYMCLMCMHGDGHYCNCVVI